MYQYASIPGLIKMLLIIGLVYFGFKILARLFAPFLVRYVAKKAEQKFGQQFGQYQRPQETKRKDGDVVIDKAPKQNKTSNKDVGEYVDYEEID